MQREPVYGLSRRQLQALRYIAESIAQQGFPPTVQELCRALGCRSPNAVYEILQALERKGYIRRVERGRARTLQLTERAFGSVGVQHRELSGRSVPLLRSGLVLDIAQLFRAPQGYVLLDPVMFPGEELFAVTVPDDVMYEEGMRADDIVIALRTEELRSGVLAVVWVDGMLFVRRLLQQGQVWELRAGGRYTPPIRFHPSEPEIAILGHVVGLLRRYNSAGLR